MSALLGDGIATSRGISTPRFSRPSNRLPIYRQYLKTKMASS